MFASQSLFQQCDGVVLVLQLLCDRGKCVLRCLESILNIISQGIGNHICSCLALSNEFIENPCFILPISVSIQSTVSPCWHIAPVIFSTVLFKITSQSFILPVLGSLLVSLSSACDPSMDGPPSNFTLLAKDSSKAPKNLSQDFFKIMRSTLVTSSALGYTTILCSPALPKCLIHPQNSALGLLKGCVQVYSQVTALSDKSTLHFCHKPPSLRLGCLYNGSVHLIKTSPCLHPNCLLNKCTPPPLFWFH
jgi:hypothetical protein